LSQSEQNLRLIENHPERLVLEFFVPNIEFEKVSTVNGDFTRIRTDGFIEDNFSGMPELLYTGRLITVPIGAELKVIIHEIRSREISLKDIGFDYPIYPAQPSYSKSTDLSKVSFLQDNNSYTEENYQKAFSPFSYTEAGFMRGQRIFEISYTPVRYNPVENTIKIYEHIEVDIYFAGADLVRTENLHSRTWSADFESLFYHTLLNYRPPLARDLLVRMPTKYVIVSFADFVPTLQPFIDWKTEQGFEVILASTNNPLVGNTTTSIKNYLQALWNAATPTDPAPSYLLIVGDIAQIPAWASSTSIASEPHVTDLTYVRLSDTSYFPDMYYGRFSANNITELTPYIEKSLVYQKYSTSNPNYLRRSVLISGHDSWSATQFCNGQINYMTSLYFNTSNTHNDFDEPSVYLHPTSGSLTSGIDAEIRLRVSEGAGWVNYTAHGDITLWDRPRFTIPQVNALSNYGMYPIVIGNACHTSAFDTMTCFAEAWLRASNKGGVIYIGGTNYTYWSEDYWWAVGLVNPPTNGATVPYHPNQRGMYDLLFHTHNEPPEIWHTSVGAMIYAGNMVVQASTSPRKNYYWEIYSVKGDPSLVPFLGAPSPNHVELPEVIVLGLNELNIIQSAPFARVAISKDGELIGSVIADALGNAILTFNPIDTPGVATIVVTAQNFQPVIHAVNVIPADGAFIILTGIENPVTNSNTVSVDSISNLFLSIKNIGTTIGENINFVLSSTSDLISIEGTNITVPLVPVDTEVNIENPFTINVAHNIPDQTRISLRLTATSGAHTWVMNFVIVVNSPKIRVSDFSLFNETGTHPERLQSGETATITLKIENIGHLNSIPGILNIYTSNPAVSISPSSQVLQTLEVLEIRNVTFDISVDNTVPIDSSVDITFLADIYHDRAVGSQHIPIGQSIEDFATGDFSAFPWTTTVTGSHQPWTIVSDNSYIGTYSARSGNITHNQTSSLQITQAVSEASTISFALKVSSEADYDELNFVINGTDMGSWSGEVDWMIVTFPVPIGTNTYRWSYIKDRSLSHGADKAWIDNIIFPVGGGQHFQTVISQVSTDAIDFGENQTGVSQSKSFEVLNLGNATLIGNFVLPTYFTLNPPTLSVPPASISVFEVIFRSPVPGEFSGNLQINSNDSLNPQIFISLTATADGVSGIDSILPVYSTALLQNYPNPFNPQTFISFTVSESEAQRVRIDIYNIKGQRVCRLVDDVFLTGEYSVVWNGRDDSGGNLSSGIYFYRMETANFIGVRKMILLK
jgi:hypothetical protein